MASLQDYESYPADFVRRRLVVFVSIVIGCAVAALQATCCSPHVVPKALGWLGRYAAYYLTRNSLTYTAPVMVADKALHMDITQASPSATPTQPAAHQHVLLLAVEPAPE